MNYLNHVNLKETIRDLVNIKQDLKDLVDYNKRNGISTFTELLDNRQKELDKLINQLETITPNTLFFVQYVDIYAFKHALENFGHNITDVVIEYEYNDSEISDTYFPTDEIIDCNLKVYYSRYAMDGYGYHVGSENVLYTFKGINRMKLGLTTGYPGNLSSWVINIDEFDITILDVPVTENPSYEHHEPDCDIFKDEDGNDIDIETIPHDSITDICSCGIIDNWEGYYPPDEDFFWNEMDGIRHFIMTNNKLPEAIFDVKTNIWNIADQINYKFNRS